MRFLDGLGKFILVTLNIVGFAGFTDLDIASLVPI